jgi:hypothetical protein
MKRPVFLFGALLILLAGTIPVRASNPVPYMDVRIAGLELCEQAVCGYAIFAGVLFGRVGYNPAALGTFGVAVNHDYPLPAPGACSNVTGGGVEIRVGLRRIRGVITQTDDGLCANVFPPNTFAVSANVTLENGLGNVVFDGLLDHRVFPPIVTGSVH